MSAGVKDKSLNSYTIYVCTCVRCVCVCDERGEGEGGGSMSAAVKVKSLNPLVERGSSTNNERPGNHPNSTKIQH
jgi:hypothetical protein